MPSLPHYVHQGLKFVPHFFTVPLDYDDPSKGTIEIFAREVNQHGDNTTNKPWLVYFQGGPGFPAGRPMGNSGWIKRALQQYRVLLLDQRGTGNSSVISHQTLAHLTPEQQADYLSLFRADNIVRDAEFIRLQFGVDKWAILGQSFGGFCSLTYLSLYPDSLLQSYITGGVPSISRHPDEVYQATFKRTMDKNQAFFAQFPQAQALCQRIADHLLENDEYLPNGQRFTVEQFQQLGIHFGMSDTFLSTYYLLENAFIEINGQTVLRYEFLHQMLQQQSFHTNPIYALLHESIYCQGFASQWSAHRVRQSLEAFNYQKGKAFYFTGEMVFPWMFEQYSTLQPLKQAAEILATKVDWTPLYGAEQLAQNRVPVSCAVYADDMFVEMDFSRETLALIPSAKAWITNEYEHNGLRADGERILDVLIAMGEQTLANQTQ
ncbi:alpha/beta fold hydrolase [Vibrio vulnificus]|uniref:alpha/beta fold hydrolase n=1 Tax=Vibrio vulnificus TaxID=672 RepID=UPI001A213DF0|nr:alpha/beta fold hydrolase [Vibrio vulnificus]EKG2483366.1 alpha/beta fold hydrolase [Vibrio vulnificus]EKG2484822.1 alpha/beta fold hydrolase [Vibrio vulnificus]ELP6771554.1 alpha/beta fold hydrolase [Vibrio vulnificus]ELP6773070.1 alpha/beta fold hydrolase [Vibrio vulnificus]MCA3901717.1 alpha/beta fold hydrolase [Vibrio vulnificus]